ncbi:hypothetical protein Mh1961_00720 [Mannheimia haemolytica]
MKFLQADIDSIVEAQENGSLTIFIGAGFSKFSETENIKFPTWGELIQELKEELHTKENDYPKIAQLYFLEFGEYKLYAKLKKFIPLHASPSKFHKKLFELLESKYVITTNWDNLLEKTISSNGLIYDVIKSEVDLVKSNIPSKLIKIHGDFDSHNVVFKEDDYLNYSIQNPLFDNFMKHMLSTTVLFLGYSYSDNDLKQMIKWIEKNSKTSPPRFILSKGLSDGEKKYLENHGIKALQILNEPENLTYENLYQTLFEYIEKTKVGTVIFEQEKNTDEFVVNYFYKKILGLSDLRVLLPEQITHLFSNCGIEYHNNCFGLHFYSDQLTIDYDESIREVHKQFFDILNCDKRCKFESKINYILVKMLSAGIIFIKNKREFIDLRKIFSNKNEYNLIEECLSDFIEFSTSMPKFNSELLTYNSKSNSDKLRLFEKSYSHIIDNFKEKKYLSSMISKFNHSAIAMRLNLDNEFKNDEIRKSFVKAQQNEFTNELISNKYPSSKKYFQPVIDLLNFKYVYKLYFDSIQDNNTFLNLEKSKRNGGFGFNRNEQRSNDRLIHVLRFCAGNDIILDIYKEFQTLMHSYVIGKINIQNLKEKFELSRYDLFILIKYIDFKDLWNLIAKDILVFVKETEGKGESFLFFDEDSKSYLKSTFDNLSELFIKHSHFFYSNTISKSFINLILILSLVKWESESLDLLLQKIKGIFIKIDIPLDFIRALNYFVLAQYKLYKDITSEKNLMLIDAVLEGFILGKFRKPFYQRVNDDLIHVYQLPFISNIEYSNKKLIEKALFHLDKDFEDENVKRYFLQKFLLPVYDISNRDTKQVFISYFDKLRLLTWSNEIPDLYGEIFRELDFLQYGCEVRGDFISFLDNWIENKFNKELMHDFNFIKSGGEELMLQYFDFLIHEKDLEAFEHLKETLEQKIAQIKKTSS